MHILFVHNMDSKYGGCQSLLRLIAALRDISPDLEVSVAIPQKSEGGELFRAAGCHVYPVPYEAYLQEKPEKKWKLPAKFVIRGARYCCCRAVFVKRLKRQIDFQTIDLIHSNSGRDDFGAILSRQLDIPLVWHLREFSDLDYDCYGYRYDPGRFMKKSCGHFIAVSDAVRKHWIKKGIPADRITTVYNGVEVLAQTEKNRADLDSGILSLVIAGRVGETKGQHLIIQAISLLPEAYKERVELDIVGDGKPGYEHRIKKMVKEKKLEKCIHFLGYQKDFQKKLGRYDCGVMCSKCEGFGMVTAEYMMAGLPVLASDTGANPELVRDGVTGFLFPYPDAEKLKDRIQFLIENKSVLKKMGAAAAKTARERFAIGREAEAIFRLYQETVGEKRWI